jgi:Peptidase family M23
MDLSAALPDVDHVSPIPLVLRSNRGVGLFGARRQSRSLIRTHLGVDLPAPADQPVFATGPGIVVQVVRRTGETDFDVTVHHSPFALGWVSSYRHLANPIVVKGQEVASGEQLARVQTNHLHFEVRQIFNNNLLAEYLAAYRAPRDPATNLFDLSSVSSNIGNAVHSLPLDPTRALYEWENRMYRNDLSTRQDHILDNVVVSNFEEVWRDRMRFVLVNAEGDGRDFFIPLLGLRDADRSLIHTLRQAFINRSPIRLVWRDSLFFSEIQPEPLTKIIAEVAVRTSY